MRPIRAVDVSTGLFVLLGFAALFFLVTQISSRELPFNESYHLTARFENIGGLKLGAPVSMAGVTVGRVENIGFDQKVYKAVVTLRINSTFNRIPNDSDASILTSGLLGGQYIGISAGGSDHYYKEGDNVQFVQDALVLENLISKFLVSMASKKDSNSDSKEEAK